MESLILKHKGQAIATRIMGGLLIIAGIMNIILRDAKMSLISWILNIFIVLYGVFMLTPWARSSKSILEAKDGVLRIKWRGWFREALIPESEIERINLGKTAILIARKGEKAKRLDIHEMEKDQKTKVYQFMIEYARQKNITIER